MAFHVTLLDNLRSLEGIYPAKNRSDETVDVMGKTWQGKWEFLFLGPSPMESEDSPCGTISM